MCFVESFWVETVREKDRICPDVDETCGFLDRNIVRRIDPLREKSTRRGNEPKKLSEAHLLIYIG